MIQSAIQTKLREAGCTVHRASSLTSSSSQSLDLGVLQPSGSQGEVNPSIATTLSHSSRTSQKHVSSAVSPGIT
jgi:hypothetical protein